MTSAISSQNSYFSFTPFWNHSNDPLPVKVGKAAAAVFINLAVLLANILKGVYNFAGSLFSSSSSEISKRSLNLGSASPTPVPPSAPPLEADSWYYFETPESSQTVPQSTSGHAYACFPPNRADYELNVDVVTAPPRKDDVPLPQEAVACPPPWATHSNQI